MSTPRRSNPGPLERPAAESHSRRQPLKLLLVSYYFPPYNAIGSVRTGKLAKYLLEQGFDVCVLTAAQTRRDESLPLDVPSDRVIYTTFVDINGVLRALARIRRRLFTCREKSAEIRSDAESANEPKEESKSIFSSLGIFFQNLTNLPDARVGWLPFALAGARRSLGDWTPDIIYASSPPPTGLIVGHLLARRYGVPWIAEFRDRWADDPYFFRPAWRERLDRSLERRIVSRAAGIVTVSEPWAEAYRRFYGRPTAVVYNGFDPADYDPADPCLGSPGSGILKIVYTGVIYPGRRDPSPLFEALHLLGDRAARVRVIFVGTDPALVIPLAARHGISRLIEVLPSVPYREALRMQQQADVLLLLQWSDPKEQGNVPGKLFEYLGARRPILGLGLEDGVPATIIRQREAGIFSNDAAKIVSHLERWLETKLAVGYIDALPESVREGFARQNQFMALQRFFSICLRNGL